MSEPDHDASPASEPVSTGCEPLDDLLGGGFERGTVTQVYGPPAAGKTNVVLSAAVEAALDGGSALYIDTEGLSLDRFHQLVEAGVSDGSGGSGRGAGGPGFADEPGMFEESGRTDGAGAPDASEARNGTAEGDGPGDATDDDGESIEDVASRIHVAAAHDFGEQEEAVRDAADYAAEVDLIVVDSATGFYRLERVADSDGGESLRKVARQVTHLLSLARKHDLAVAITNQVFTDPDSDRTRALGGNTLEHWTGVVLRLDRFRGGNRRATLEKHRSKPAGDTATFQITNSGLGGTDDF